MWCKNNFNSKPFTATKIQQIHSVHYKQLIFKTMGTGHLLVCVSPNYIYNNFSYKSLTQVPLWRSLDILIGRMSIISRRQTLKLLIIVHELTDNFSPVIWMFRRVKRYKLKHLAVSHELFHHGPQHGYTDTGVIVTNTLITAVFRSTSSSQHNNSRVINYSYTLF